MRALRVLPAAFLAGCLAAPPDSAGEPDRADCPALEFTSLDGFYVTAAEGCRVTAPGRLRLVQDGVVAAGDGCYVEPQTSFPVGSIEIAYGAESDLPVSLVGYRKSDLVALGLTRFADKLELTERTQEQEVLHSASTDFELSWTLWRLEVADGMAHAKVGPEPGALEVALTIPFVLDDEMGIVIGSWPASGTVSEREASFDHLSVCPP